MRPTRRALITGAALLAGIALSATAVLQALPTPEPYAAYGSRVPAISRLSTAEERAQQRKAVKLLAKKKKQYKHLKGVKVRIGYARGYQAVAYYGRGEIVISPNHRASLKRIINHEVWHVIDWRANKRMDWGEKLPPRSYKRYKR